MGRPTDVPADFKHLPVSVAEQDQSLEVGDLVAELCRRLGIRPDCTAEIRISPSELWVWTRTFDLNSEGRRHATATGEIAESVTRWDIATTIPNGEAPTQVQDDEDLTVSGRILDVLRTTDLREGCWDGAVEWILTGEGGWE